MFDFTAIATTAAAVAAGVTALGLGGMLALGVVVSLIVVLWRGFAAKSR